MQEVKWWDWLLAGALDLKRLGVDPAQRLNQIGHKRPLSTRWSRTIGMWAVNEPKDLIKTAFPLAKEEVQKRRARTAYDVFKYRHRLVTKHDFVMTHLDPPNLKVFMEIGTVMVATYAYARMSDFVGRGSSLGSAAFNGVAWSRNANGELVDEPLGILPIEAVLYYRALEHIFSETSLSYVSWIREDSAKAWYTRAEYWRDLGCDEIVSLPKAAVERYPQRDEED